MNKTAYLGQLETALREKYPEPQVRDILSDYEDFFASGTAEGKSEAELCEEFGPPEQAAREVKGETEAATPRRGEKRSVFSCVFLAVLVFAVLWPFFGPVFEISPGRNIPEGPVGFWLSLLFPLALEAILALWASQSNPPKRALKWVPRANLIFAVPVAAVLVLLVFCVFTIPQIAESIESNSSGPVNFLMTTVYYGSFLSELLLFASIILSMLYSIRRHKKARWFLFLDTALLTLLLNFDSLLAHIRIEDYDAAKAAASCFLWAVLPNLAAAGVYWIVLRIVSSLKLRRVKAWTGR